MNAEPSPRTRGTIVKVPDASPGLLFFNGQQKPFTVDDTWKSPVAPAPNMTVDVDLDSLGAIKALTVVDSAQLNKERMAQLSGVAQERGKEAAKMAQQGVGALAARMGTMALASAVVVVIAYFFLPSASIAAGMVAGQTYTFSTLLGTDFSNMAQAMGATGSSLGLLGILGFVALVAPFAAPFIRTPWSHYLYAAPLAIVIIGWLAIYMNQNKAFGELAKLAGSSPFSFSWGLYVLALAAIVLATGALKKPAA
jgi:hypothetical protein